MRRSQVRIPSLAPGKHDGSDAIVSGQSCFFFMGKGVFYEPPKLAETLIMVNCMGNYRIIITFIVCAIAFASIISLSSRMIVEANSEGLVTEKYDSKQSRFDFEFSTNEATGTIKSFDVSDHGKIATCINPSNINVYDEYGNFDFAIYTNLTRTKVILQWDKNTLLIYLNLSSDCGSKYDLVMINGYEDYQLYSCPVTDNTEKFWGELEVHEDELITDKGRYYLQYGNLRYKDNESNEDYAVTENTSFRPWMLLSIPILTVIIWFSFLRKRVKRWEEKQHN